MKKLFTILTVLILSLSILTSCSFLNWPEYGSASQGGNNEGDLPNDEDGDDETSDNEKNPDENDQGGDNNQDENDGVKHTYTSFTPSDKQIFNKIAGEEIPFIPNDNYFIEEYSIDDELPYEVGVNFYTFGNTEEEFDEYRKLFNSYTFDGSEEDEYGDTWYYYTTENGNYIDLSFYTDGELTVVDVYIYYYTDDIGNGGSDDNDGEDEDFLYDDFTSDEKALFNEYFGEVIPFFVNNEYYVEEYTYDYGDGEYESGVNFYVIGATEAQFQLYRVLYSDYSYDGNEVDDYGDTWYFYTAESGYFVDMVYYQSEDGEFVADIYVYFILEGSPEDGGSGNNGGNGGEGGNGGNGGEITDGNIITNAGAGLPYGEGGVYDIDFTDATHVKDVTDQGYYIDGCPTVGSPKVLVIPVDFNDIGGRNKGYSIENIVRAFSGGTGETDYYSVHDYYYISSYGKLDLDITVIDEWFVPEYTSTYYANATIDYYGEQINAGEQLILDEALDYLSGIMDLSEFDSDNNGIIDAVVMINTLEIDDTTDFYWAFRYWNLYTDSEDYYYEYDGVSANDYMWASYSFMHESYDSLGYADYTDTSVMNTYTFIHEFGHILGLDDYYDTSANGNHPMDGYDIMDAMLGDHNAFSKFNLGWLTSSRLVTAKDSVTLTLEAFSKSGDTIIIANNFDPKLGAYQEYYVIVYYTMDDLNGGDFGYFTREGVVVYHVNASLYCEEYEGEAYYDIYNNNTSPSDEYGSQDNLIEFVPGGEGNLTYISGDRLPSVTDDQGNKLVYSFVVDNVTEDYVTITFTKN